MSRERVLGALYAAAGSVYFAMMCVFAPATHGASVVFGVLVGGGLCWAGRELWRS